eukprot:8184018-Alexandrium_andersonii.AAC.1
MRATIAFAWATTAVSSRPNGRSARLPVDALDIHTQVLHTVPKWHSDCSGTVRRHLKRPSKGRP